MLISNSQELSLTCYPAVVELMKWYVGIKRAVLTAYLNKEKRWSWCCSYHFNVSVLFV